MRQDRDTHRIVKAAAAIAYVPVPPRGRRLTRVTRRAVTLIELLVVAFVISVLLLITVPVIRHFKVKQDDLVNIRNMGATMQDFFAWANDHDGVVVNAGLPDTAAHNWFYTDLGAGIEPEMHYLNHSALWPRVLLESGLTPSPHWHATIGPDTPERLDDILAIGGPEIAYGWMASHYRYPDPMLTRPDIWLASPTHPRSFIEYSQHYMRVKHLNIRTPAAKGVLVYTRGLRANHLAVAFADGHAAVHEESTAAPTGVHPQSAAGRPGRPVFATLDGHLGRDF